MIANDLRVNDISEIKSLPLRIVGNCLHQSTEKLCHEICSISAFYGEKATNVAPNAGSMKNSQNPATPFVKETLLILDKKLWYICFSPLKHVEIESNLMAQDFSEKLQQSTNNSEFELGGNHSIHECFQLFGASFKSLKINCVSND